MTSIEAPGKAVISVEDMGVSYWVKNGAFRRKRFWALNDLSFDLCRGDSLGVVGKNGSGKSTLLRLLAGVMSPDRGTVTNHGAKVSLLSLQLGFIPHLSGRQNAILSGLFLGLRRKEIEEKMNDIIAFSELEEFIEQPILSYSSGMKARLGFAVAFQADPDVLLIDEVTSVGDMAFQKKSFAVMREKIASDKSIILVTRHGESVRKLCNRAIWLHEGKINAEGDVDMVLDAYHDFVFGRKNDQPQQTEAKE